MSCSLTRPPYGHAKVNIGHHNSGHYGRNGHFGYLGNDHRCHKRGHTVEPVE